MVKKIWTDEETQLEIGFIEKSEKQKEAMISLMLTAENDWQRFNSIDMNKADVMELIDELKIWIDILETDNK